jgi:hypothetical protein
VLYNLIFVLPSVVILIGALGRPMLNRAAHWNLHHKEWVQLTVGASVVVIGLVILATVCTFISPFSVSGCASRRSLVSKHMLSKA